MLRASSPSASRQHDEPMKRVVFRNDGLWDSDSVWKRASLESSGRVDATSNDHGSDQAVGTRKRIAAAVQYVARRRGRTRLDERRFDGAGHGQRQDLARAVGCGTAAMPGPAAEPRFAPARIVAFMSAAAVKLWMLSAAIVPVTNPNFT